MKSEIALIAEAIIANTRVIELLIAKLPDAAKAELAAVVNPTPVTTPVTTVPAAESPVTVPVTVTMSPVVSAPVAPAPVVETPVAPAAPASKKCPFVDQRGLITYVMDMYREFGQAKGAKIQQVLDTVGIKNINEVKPEMYQPLYDGVEAMRHG